MITIKKATSDNAQIVLRLAKKLFKEIDHTGPVLNLRELKKLIDDNTIQAFLAINDSSKYVGVLTFAESTGIYTNGTFGVINELFVLPEYRSKRVGTFLIKKIKRHAIENKWTRLELTAPDGDGWSRTIKFYMKEGFVKNGPRIKFEL